jgi:hypothetical protein
VLEGKCLKEGLRNGAEASIPVRLAHRLRRARSAVYCLTAYCLIQKARGGFSGAGLFLATMKICR